MVIKSDRMMIYNKITTEREDIVTKERLKKELSKVDDQLAGLQARKRIWKNSSKWRKMRRR